MKIVNDFKPLNIFAKLHRRCLIGSSYVIVLWINSHWLGICNSHWWKPSFKNVNFIVVICLLLTGDSHWQRGSTKTKCLWRNSLLVQPSFLLKMNSCTGLFRFFAPVVEHLFCRTHLRWLHLKQTGENNLSLK